MSYKYLHILKICLQSLPILSWKTKRYLSFSFHEYLLLQKRTSKEISTTISKSLLLHLKLVHFCSLLSPVSSLSGQHPPPDFTVCLSLGSLQRNPGDKDLRWKVIYLEGGPRKRGEGIGCETRKGDKPIKNMLLYGLVLQEIRGLFPGALRETVQDKPPNHPTKGEGTGVKHPVLSLIGQGLLPGALTSGHLQPALTLLFLDRDSHLKTPKYLG